MAEDKRIEKWIESFGVGWQYLKEVSLKNIDFGRSLSNQARGEALDKGLVEEYALAMMDGSEFPPIVIYQSHADHGKFMLVVIDGNHRIHAAQMAERDKTDAYMVLTENLYLLKEMTWSANAEGSKRTTQQERLAQAVKMITEHGRPLVEVCRRLHVPRGALQHLLDGQNSAKRAAKLGVEVNGLPLSILGELGRIQNDPAFVAALAVTKDHHVKTDQAIELGRLIRAQRSETAMLEAVKDFAVGLPAAAPNGKPTLQKEVPVCTEFFRRARRFVEYTTKYPMPSQLQLTTRKDIEYGVKVATQLEEWARRFKRDAEYTLSH